MRNKLVNLKKGHCILQEQPFVYSLKSKYRTERCDYCLSNAKKLLKCSNCKYVYYCGRECQKDSWPIHQIECGRLKAVAPRIVPDAARVMAKIVWKLNRGGDLVKGYYTTSCFRKFRDLMSHYVDLKKDTKRLEHFESLCVVLNELLGDIAIPNSTELLGIYGRLCVNGFSISNGEMNSIATGLYLGVSILDHSCKPNAVATFEGTTISIRLLEDLPVLDITKIFISYIDVMSSPEDRMEELSKSYYFNCLCPKCSDPLESFTMNAAACPNTKCDEPLDLRNTSVDECPTCGQAVTQQFRDEFKLVTEFTKQKLFQMKDIAYLDVCKICLKKHENVLHPYNYLHVKTLDTAFESAIEMQKWGEAMEYGVQLMPVFRKYNGDYSALLGVMCVKLGKLQLYMNRQRDAVAMFKEASKILKVTHGEYHSLYKQDLVPLMRQASIEN